MKTGAEELVEAIEDFEQKTGLILAACMISMKDGSSLRKVLNLMDAPVIVYKSTKVGIYFENKQNLVVNGIFTKQNRPKTLETFQMVKHASLEGSNLNNQQKETIQELFMRHQQYFSRNSNELGYADKIEHPIKFNKDAQPFGRSYFSMSFDKKEKQWKKLSKI